jgi:NAD(P)-dependent dehydrogenase (short-subunit alcohol dehydrogenase family)
VAEFLLSGKAAIVTGGAQGMGRAMAVALARAGANVLAVDVEREPLDQTTAQAQSVAGRMIGLVADVSRDDERTRIAEACRSSFGGVDVLINNAGIGQATIRADYAVNPLRPWEVSGEHLLRFVAVHAVAPLRLASEVLPDMRAKGRGRIITVVTDFAVMMRGTFTAYGGAKAASEAYMSGLAGETQGTGVTVNVITPGGMVNTRMVPDRPGMVRNTLLQPDVMDATILWLASNDSDGVTGRRFNASLWDSKLAPREAAAKAAAPIGWAGTST